MKHLLLPLILLVAGWCQAETIRAVIEYRTDPNEPAVMKLQFPSTYLDYRTEVTAVWIQEPNDMVFDGRYTFSGSTWIKLLPKIEIVFYVNGTSRIYHDDPACQYVAESSRIITLTQEKADEFQAQLRLCLSCLAKKLQE